MDHQTALSSQAVERYTLDELTSPQREEFEEHFFDCRDCTASLQEYEVFAANTRAVFKEDAQTKPATSFAASAAQPGWWTGLQKWFGIRTLIPAFAALALAFIVFRNPAQVTPDPAGEQSAWSLVADARDGAVPHHVITQTTVWVAPAIELVAGMTPNRWASYHWEVRADGKLVDQGDGNANPLKLKIPASKFESGKQYRLTVQGDPATPPVASSFIIDRK